MRPASVDVSKACQAVFWAMVAGGSPSSSFATGFYGAPSENATDTNATDAVLEAKLSGIVDEVLAPIDPGLTDEPELTLPVSGEPVVDNIL